MEAGSKSMRTFTKRDTFANSVDSEEAARNEPYHEDQSFVLTDTGVCNNVCIQMEEFSPESRGVSINTTKINQFYSVVI